MAKNARDLEALLSSIDGNSYPAYKQTAGRWDFKEYILSIDHVQGDPFASPSSLRITLPPASAGLPKEYLLKPHRRIAAADHLLRGFSKSLSQTGQDGRAGSGKSGLIFTDRPGQEVRSRSALQIAEDGTLTVCFEVGFPANGRRIHVSPLLRILFKELPAIVRKTLFFKNVEQTSLQKAIWLSDDQEAIRTHLLEQRLVAFVANHSVLPRESGISQKPMKNAIPFETPESMAVTLELPHKGKLTGMGIREGVTLIIGGGYHGKSTLLSALECGIYNHIAGDGREYVITRKDAVKSRAEDGRSVFSVDISMFIGELPDGTDTRHFSTENASGSTSQAAGISEALENGSKVLLLDEDTCATNLMVRDELMQKVVAGEEEPIKPFVHRVRGLYDDLRVSTVLVAGSSGAFFSKADTIIRMDRYRAYDATEAAKAAANQMFPEAAEKEKAMEPHTPLQLPDTSRKPKPPSYLKKPGARIKCRTNGTDSFSIDKNEIDLRGVEQIYCREMTTGIMLAVKKILISVMNGNRTMEECVSVFMKQLDEKGVYALFDGVEYNGVALPRKQEIHAALSRYRYQTPGNFKG